jgi:hypothetical protein
MATVRRRSGIAVAKNWCDDFRAANSARVQMLALLDFLTAAQKSWR